MIEYFVIQKKHDKETGKWDNTITVKGTENEARHQFHAFMSTYAYGVKEQYDYISCMIEDMNGAIIQNEEIYRATVPEETEE